MSEQLLNTPSKHSLSVSGLLDTVWNKTREGAFHVAKGPLARIAEAAAVSVLKNIRLGQLKITSLSGHTHAFGSDPTSTTTSKYGLQSELRVVNDVFWIRLCCMGDLGFSESYMFGEVDCPDLIQTFKIFLYNRPYLQTLENSRLASLLSMPQRFLNSSRFLNSLGNAQNNISAHYDISNAMFAGFLSKDMTYSCAIFKELDEDLNLHMADNLHSRIAKRLTNIKEETMGHKSTSQPLTILDSPPIPDSPPHPIKVVSTNGITKDGSASNTPSNQSEYLDTLHAAQVRKLDHIIRKAQIQPGMRVLEIGSGWGSLALRVVTTIPDTVVDTITLSVHQQTLARARIREASIRDGLEPGSKESYEERIRVHLMDYRAMPSEWAGAFDRVVSVEMLEAVGVEFLEEYWRVVDWALKGGVGTDAVGVVQCITIPEARFSKYASEVDFIRKWVLFPGGILPTLTHLISSLSAGSQGRLTVDSVSNIGPHYARTLREWRRVFEEKFADVIEPALRSEYPDVMGEGCGEKGKREVEVFRRKWIYYYCYCEVGFTTRSLGDHIITFTREGNETFGCTIYE